MKRLVIALALVASSVQAETDLCANARTAENAFRVALRGLENVALLCQGRNTIECQTARQAVEEYEKIANGMGIVAVVWTRIQACED